MAAQDQLFSRRRVTYTPILLPDFIPGPLSQRRPPIRRPQRITISSVPPDYYREDPPQAHTPSSIASEKLATSRDSALRFFRSVVSSQPKVELVTQYSDPQSQERRNSAPQVPPAAARSTSDTGQEGEGANMPSLQALHHRASNVGLGLLHSPLARQSPMRSTDSFENMGARARAHSVANAPAKSSQLRNGSISTNDIIPQERPIASSAGVSVGINLAEPVLFLQGFQEGENAQRSTAMLRGALHLKVTKTIKIKTISLKFKGTATTKWPEGIPPKKTEFEEVDTIMSHTWPFYNAQFATAEGGSGASHVQLANGSPSEAPSPFTNMSPFSSQTNLSSSRERKLSLQVNSSSGSFEKGDKHPASVAQKGYRSFHPGDYIYNFELPLDSKLPETIEADLGSVKYELEATVERAGAFRGNLVGTKEVTLIRAPGEGSLEQVEPIAISRNWEDQLHYDIVISGKSFPLGSKIPIAFKLTPLAKVQCHRVKVFITENTEYFCSNKRVHRMEPTRKVLLYEKRADGTTTSTFTGSSARITAGGGVPFDQREAAARGDPFTPQDSSNLLGRLEQDSSVGPTEMEFNVQLPGCHQATDKDRLSKLHFDTTYSNIQVHHWIKIVLRLSKPDVDNPEKRRHFEISIDSPFHILSCRANQQNTSLPAYSSPETDPANHLADCGCPGVPRRRISPQYVPTLNSLNGSRASVDAGQPSDVGDMAPMRPSLARPPTAHFNGTGPRPMHLLRQPSFNPPAFEDEEPPPALATPPPNYGDIASPTAGHGLADYFSRFNSMYDGSSDEEDSLSRRGRVNVPLTPGGRVNRSLDLGRGGWAPVGANGLS